MTAALALEQHGLALKAAGRLDEAIAAFTQLTRLTPDAAGAHYNLANTCLAAGRLADAVPPYRRAIALAPDFAHAHNNLGLVLLHLNQPAEAAIPLARAAALNPANPGTQHLAGMALLRANRLAEAMPYLTEADRLAPDQAAILTDIADANRRLGKLHAVPPLARRAAALAPDLIATWNNLANAERDVARFPAAAEASRRALAIDPDNADAHCNLALTLLAAGEWRQAWPHWEYRWHGLAAGAPAFPGPVWDGGPVHGTLYLHAEQGLGDTIQFARYVPLARRAAGPHARLVLLVQRPLLSLMRTLDGGAELRTEGDPIPDFTAQAPLMSLPLAFATSLATAPAETPYLSADPPARARWAARLAALPGRRIGLIWAGNRDFPFDAQRSIPPRLLDGLAAVPNVSFVSLQIGAGPRPDLRLADWTAELTDFAETAALIAGLDLVVGVDTACIHLAGALGVPVWLLNRFAGDWRWDNAGDGCVWYPTLRQFKQTAPGDWGPVLERVGAALLGKKAGGNEAIPPGPPSFHLAEPRSRPRPT